MKIVKGNSSNKDKYHFMKLFLHYEHVYNVECIYIYAYIYVCVPTYTFIYKINIYIYKCIMGCTVFLSGNSYSNGLKITSLNRTTL